MSDDSQTKTKDDELAEGQLNAVAGGINPQPLPPHAPPPEERD